VLSDIQMPFMDGYQATEEMSEIDQKNTNYCFNAHAI